VRRPCAIDQSKSQESWRGGAKRRATAAGKRRDENLVAHRVDKVCGVVSRHISKQGPIREDREGNGPFLNLHSGTVRGSSATRFAACGSANHGTVSKVSWRSKVQLLLCCASASRAGSNLRATGLGWRPGTGMAKALRAHEHTPRRSGPPEFRRTPASSRPSSRHALRSLKTPPRTQARTPRHASEPRCRTSHRSSLPIAIKSERLCGLISCRFCRRLLPARATKSHQTAATAETGRTACVGATQEI
jgi:hypothetical protein